MYWNPVLLSILYKDLASLQFFLEKLNVNAKLALRAPPVSAFTKMIEHTHHETETFPLMLTLHNRDAATLEYLWTKHQKLWDNFHLPFLVQAFTKFKWIKGLEIIINSNTAKKIYSAMFPDDKYAFSEVIVS